MNLRDFGEPQEGSLTENVPLPVEDADFLVVPVSGGDEGSYGLDSSSHERPPAAAGGCRPSQALGCP